MTDVSLSALRASNPAAALDGSEILELTQGGSSAAAIISDIANFMRGFGSLPVVYLEDHGCDPTGVVDSTTGFQAAIAACATSGGVIMSKQVDATFLIGGALQDPTGANAQLTLPVKNYGADAPITVSILGYRPPPAVVSVTGTEPIPTGGLVIKSTLAAGTGAVLGGANGSNFTNVNLVLRNAIIRTIANPTITGIDASKVACIDFDGVLVDTGSFDVGALAQPTTATSYGIKFPAINNGAHTTVGVVDVVGFYTGALLGEHLTANQINCWGCVRTAESPAGYHAMLIDRLQSLHCQHGIVATGGASYLQVTQFNAEHAASGWQVPVDDILDSSNYLHGNVKWHAVLAGSGVSSSFTKTGASSLNVSQLDALASSGGSGSVLPVNAQTGTAYTLALTDAPSPVYQGIVTMNNAAANTLTVPPNSSVAFPVGTQIQVAQLGAGQTAIAAGVGVTVNNPSSLTARAQYSTLVLTQVAANAWVLGGDMT
ncbi:hypothetical protein ISP17_11455 [Dyella ginsengisoli]|uniref:Uncharacterized protein n=1 Tax=Dyella ginsengisoli TaxID=363848 RepID=A0ABW8JUJ5_9GAMM